jgi:hypothetical protein
MTGIVKRAGSNVEKMPSFAGIEKFMTIMATVREEAAVAREPSRELLGRLDHAIALAKDQAQSFAAAAQLGGIVSVAGQQDATIFGQLLIDDVMDLEPPIAAVEIACRHWRQRSKFLPAISEMLAEVKAAKDQVENTVEFVSRLPALRERMARDLPES